MIWYKTGSLSRFSIVCYGRTSDHITISPGWNHIFGELTRRQMKKCHQESGLRWLGGAQHTMKVQIRKFSTSHISLWDSSKSSGRPSRERSSENENKVTPEVESKRKLKRLRESKKHIMNELRLSRAEKKQTGRKEYIESRWELARAYKGHCKTVSDTLREKGNIGSLFANQMSQYNTHETLGESRICNDSQLATLLGTDFRTYSNPELQSTIMLLVTLLINSVLVELNVRNMLHDEHLEYSSDSFIFRDELFNNIKDEERKHEILKYLVTNFYSKESGAPSTFEEFFTFLNKDELRNLFENEFKKSDFFNSLEIYRYYFHYFKTSHYLNYDNSDIKRNYKSWEPLQFKRQVVNNFEYIMRLKKCFEKYDSTISNAHLNLGLQIANILLSCKEYTPDMSIFKYMIDGLGTLKLFNYQSLVYDSLPLVDHISTALASPPTTQFKPVLHRFNFEHLVSENPGFLETLIDYQIHRGTTTTFKELLSFYRLDEVQANESILEQSKLSVLLARSRFSRNNKSDIQRNSINPPHAKVHVNPSSIYTAIKASILLKQFQFIDPLFNKLLTHSVEDQDTVKVALTNESIVPGKNLVSQKSSIKEITEKVFTKDIFKLLLFAARESDDVGRLMWVIPHLDRYIEFNSVGLNNYITQLKKRVLEHEHEKDSVFFLTSEDSRSPIDVELIREIYETLDVLRLDGKLNQYNLIFDFAATIAPLENVEFSKQVDFDSPYPR